MIHRFISNRPFYPWLIAVLALLIVAVSNGMGNSAITVFDAAILAEFDWSTGELKVRDAINFLGAAMLVFFAGMLVDRIGTKPLLLVGLGALTVVYFTYPEINSLSDIYLLHVLVAVTLASAGNMVAVVTAASWMPQRRGLAVGMAIAGTSAGGMLLPPLFAYMNASYGWQDSLRTLAAIPLSVCIFVALLVKNTRGRTPAPQNTEGILFSEAIRRREFWIIGAAGAATYFSILALFANLFLYLRTLGYSDQHAAFGLSTLSVAALIGKLGSGYMADKLKPMRLLKICMLVMLAGLTISSLLPLWVFAGLAITGIGWGSLHTLYNFVLLALFGMRDAGKINGSISVAEALGGGLGIISAGFLFDYFGSYDRAFLVMLVVMTVGLILTSRLRDVRST